ncbi:MAG TPA: hypothetical protein ENJ50_06700, partial [Planctomycetaceae bacterium]|nr:hypothetical protein [Planctomycetaceae bacterium]
MSSMWNQLLRWPNWLWRRGRRENGGDLAPTEQVASPASGDAGSGRSDAGAEQCGASRGSSHLVEEMIRLGRAPLLLRPQIAANLSPEEHAEALRSMEDQMALVPEGEVLMLPTLSSIDECGAPPVLQVEAIFLDRHPVTNREFQAFVDAGGYEQMPLWDESIWAALLEFVDSTGQPGPAGWRDGCYPAERGDHPVVGVSWYEASAYARWVGKRLPSGPEWVKAASWPVATPGGKPCQRRFPWGETMERDKTRL